MRMLPKNVCTDFIVSQNTNRSNMSWVIDQIYVFSPNLLSHHNKKDRTLTELANMMGLVRLQPEMAPLAKHGEGVNPNLSTYGTQSKQFLFVDTG